MKRALVGLIAAVPLTLGVATAAQAKAPASLFGGGETPTAMAAVVGTVQSVNGDGSFVANAYALNPSLLGGLGGTGLGGTGTVVPPTVSGALSQIEQLLSNLFGSGSPFAGILGGGSGLPGLGGLPVLSGLPGLGGGSSGLSGILQGILGGLGSGSGWPLGLAADHVTAHAPTATQVTILTDSSTKLLINGKSGTASDLAQGDKFLALFKGSPTASIQTLTANPAVAILARGTAPKPQLYAFVGTVSSVDTTKGTVTVNVSHGLPSSVIAAGGTDSFTVGSGTVVLGGSGSGLVTSLSDVSAGDIVAGGLIAPAGDTLAQVEALPLKVLFDIPSPTQVANSAAKIARAKRHAFQHALSLLKKKHLHKHHKHHA